MTVNVDFDQITKPAIPCQCDCNLCENHLKMRCRYRHSEQETVKSTKSIKECFLCEQGSPRERHVCVYPIFKPPEVETECECHCHHCDCDSRVVDLAGCDKCGKSEVTDKEWERFDGEKNLSYKKGFQAGRESVIKEIVNALPETKDIVYKLMKKGFLIFEKDS